MHLLSPASVSCLLCAPASPLCPPVLLPPLCSRYCVSLALAWVHAPPAGPSFSAFPRVASPSSRRLLLCGRPGRLSPCRPSRCVLDPAVLLWAHAVPALLPCCSPGRLAGPPSARGGACCPAGLHRRGPFTASCLSLCALSTCALALPPDCFSSPLVCPHVHLCTGAPPPLLLASTCMRACAPVPRRCALHCFLSQLMCPPCVPPRACEFEAAPLI